MELNHRLVNIPPSGIRRIGQLAKARPGCIALSIGEPDLDAPERIRRQIADAIVAGDTHYPPNAGISDLRGEIANAVNERFSTDYAPGETVVTIGSTEALASAIFAILNPGDEVIVPIPTFNLYQAQIELAGGVFVPLHLRSDDFQIDAAALEALITPRTRAILFASPNNPTGTILNAESLACLRRAALDHDLYLINDSVYDRLLYTDFFPTLMGDPALRDRLIYVNAFSKTYAMTGVRIGYALADQPVMDQMIKAHSFLVVSVAGCIQSGCRSIFSLSVEDSVTAFRKRRDLVMDALRDMHLPCPVPEGAFYAFPSIREFGIPDETFCLQLIEQGGLALVPSSCFGVPGHVRISFCYELSILEEGMKRLARFVQSLRA